MATIFWNSKYYIMHAAALTSLEMLKLDTVPNDDETYNHQAVIDQVVLSTLIIPFNEIIGNIKTIGFNLLGTQTKKVRMKQQTALFQQYDHPSDLSRSYLISYITTNDLLS